MCDTSGGDTVGDAHTTELQLVSLGIKEVCWSRLLCRSNLAASIRDYRMLGSEAELIPLTFPLLNPLKKYSPDDPEAIDETEWRIVALSLL